MLTLFEGVNHLPIPAMGFGVIALVLLFIALFVVLHIGGSRPHS